MKINGTEYDANYNVGDLMKDCRNGNMNAIKLLFALFLRFVAESPEGLYFTSFDSWLASMGKDKYKTIKVKNALELMYLRSTPSLKGRKFRAITISFKQSVKGRYTAQFQKPDNRNQKDLKL